MALSKIRNDSLADTAVHGRRNLVINGAMQVAQRATSVTAGGGGYNTVDRMRTSQQSGGFTAIDQSQSTDAPDGFSYSLKWVNSGSNSLAAGKSVYLEYAIEGQDIQHLQYGKSSAKKTTLSFWVKNSIAGTYGITLSRVDETRSNVKTYTVDTADTWEHKTVTFEGDTTTAVPSDNTRGLNIFFMLRGGSNLQTSSTGWQAGSNKTTSSQTDWPATDDAEFYVTGVQLEVGDTATPFEHRSYGEELALCHRYYEQQGGTGYYSGIASCWSTTEGRVVIKYSTKRSHPTVSTSGSTNLYDGDSTRTINSFTASGARLDTVLLYGSLASGTVVKGRAGQIYSASNNHQIKIDAEL